MGRHEDRFLGKSSACEEPRAGWDPAGAACWLARMKVTGHASPTAWCPGVDGAPRAAARAIPTGQATFPRFNATGHLILDY